MSSSNVYDHLFVNHRSRLTLSVVGSSIFRPFSQKFLGIILNNSLNFGIFCGFRPCVYWTRCSGVGYRMGTFAFSSRSARFWIGVGEVGTSNPAFPAPRA